MPLRALYSSAVGSGFSYANLAVALPLYALATGRSVSFAAALLALQTCAIALGALAAGIMGALAARLALAGGLAVMAVGQAGLLLAPAGPALGVGAVVHGIGMGLFWVATQALLASRSGTNGSERAFVRQYVLYVVGTAIGAALTGIAASLLEVAGLSHSAGIRGTFLLALGVAVIAAASCRDVRVGSAPRRRAASPACGLAVQLPDLLLVAGIAFLLSLTPIVLRSTYRFSPFEIGVVVGLVAGAKIAGSCVAGWLVAFAGSRRAVFGMLAVAAPLLVVLATAHTAGLFVAVLLVAALLTTGVWPILVDAAHARVSPEERSDLAVAWNVREYLVIAAATGAGGWVLSAFSGPTVALLIAGAFVACSAAAAAALLRLPRHALA